MVRRPFTALLAALFAGLLALPAAAGAAPFTTPLPIPQVLTGSDITIPIEEAAVPILPGAPTNMWTFGGTFPGPTIRRPAGSVTRVTFENHLPAGKGSLTIHHHGEHVASADDGQPDDQLIPAGGSKTYTYDLTENGQPERAAFQWYHDHRLDVTGRNVWNGLAGMFIVDDDFDQSLPLPKGPYDVPLMVVDRSFDATNQLTYPDPIPFGDPGLGRTYPGTGEPPSDLILGTRILVNGADQPRFDVVEHKYRLRLLNASNSRVMTFSLDGALPMQQIATESGLLPHPVQRSTLTLGPAERAEVVVDFDGLTGSDVVMHSDAGDVMQFHVTGDAFDDTSVPDDLRPAPDLGTSTRARSFNLGLVEDPERARSAWAINGLTFDHNRADAGPKLGSTETWTFSGAAKTHIVHIHGTDFRVISRDGAPPPAWESGLKETIVVEPGEKVVVRLRFTDHLGAFVFHCHVLEHEDNGMMAQYVVSKDGDAVTPTPTPTATPTVTPTPPAGTPNLALRWAHPPRRLAAHTKVKLKLEVRSTGTAAAPAAKVALGLTGGLTSGRKGRRHAVLAVPALAAGASRTFTVTVRVPRKLADAKLAAKLAAPVGGATTDDRALLAYHRSGRTLRRSAIKAVAADFPGFLCRL